jgi:C4-dicarboxylate transporter DctM subunit
MIFFKVIDFLSNFGGAASALIMLVVAAFVVLEVITRVLLNMPTNWSVEYSVYGLIAVTFLGAAYVQKQGIHISVDFISTRLSERTKMALELLTYAWTIAFLIIFLFPAVRMVLNAWARHRVSTTVLRTPMWIPYGIMVIGFILLLLQFVKQMVSKILDITSNKKETGIPKPSTFHIEKSYIILPLFIFLLAIGLFLFNSEGSYRIIGFTITLLTILATGTPVFMSLALVGGVGLFILGGGDFNLFVQLPVLAYTSMESFVLAALPLFIFAGGLFAQSGLTGSLFDFCNSWLSFLPGNLAMATIVCCAVFAALSGSSVAVAATVGMIAIPAMIERGYDKRLACGAVTAAGTLGSMIPPSNQFILYGAITDTSVGQLFVGGVLPGIFMALAFMCYIYVRYKNDPNYKPQGNITWRKRLELTKLSFPVLMAPVIILGGIYGGFFTPTEAAAVAVLHGFVLCLVFRKISLKNAFKVFADAASKSSMILMAIVGAMVLGGLITILQIAQKFAQFAVTSGFPHWGVVCLIMLLALILGCFMDGIALTLIVVPITFSAILAMGLSPVWFGVLFCLVMEIGLVTPPVGMTLYTVKGVTGEKMEEIVRGAIPFLVLMLACLLIVGIFEPLSTWLPSLMVRGTK